MARPLTTAKLRAAARRAGRGERVVVPGSDVAVLSADDLARLEALEDAADVAAAEEAMAEGPARPYDELRRKYGLA